MLGVHGDPGRDPDQRGGDGDDREQALVVVGAGPDDLGLADVEAHLVDAPQEPLVPDGVPAEAQGEGVACIGVPTERVTTCVPLTNSRNVDAL